MTSLISADDTWTLWAVILVGTALSIYLEQTYRWAAKISGPVLAMILAMLLSNARIMPPESTVNHTVENYLVPVAVPLLLFRANIFRIVRTTGPMFLVFHLSALGTILGALLAAVVFRHVMSDVPQAAGIMTASYTGGAVNFFAVKESFHVSSDLTNPLLVADTFIMTSVFIVLITMSGMRFFRRHYPHPHSLEADNQAGRPFAAEHWRAKEISLLDIAKALAIAVAIAAAASWLAGIVQEKATMLPYLLRELVGNKYVLITLFSVAAATVCSRQMERIGGSDELGTYLLYIFFFEIGLPANFWLVVRNVPLMFAFCSLIAVVNLVVTFGVGKLLRLNLEELALGVNVTLGGPPSAAAMAIAKGWTKTVQPAVLVGIWGYAIGTFLGVMVGKILLICF
jgi:uncharacterized membrane protein